ncbi:MAG: hypothetical protein HY327_01610 [Chloroflexi bacterium]|nr:hypothetical protein [Chloroflexota bacterium]
MKSIKQICFLFALAQALVACAVPATNPTIAATVLPAVASSPPAPTEARTQTPTRPNTTDPSLTASPVPTPTRPNTTNPIPAASPVTTCPSNAEGQRGLYVIYIEPLPSLIWDPTPRQFRVGVCNTLAESLVPGSRFRLSVYAPETKSPLGQTSALSAQLTPGVHELMLGSWTPGLQNHVTACAVTPSVEILVEYNDFPAANNFRPVLWSDGSERKNFSVACGGNFP